MISADSFLAAESGAVASTPPRLHVIVHNETALALNVSVTKDGTNGILVIVQPLHLNFETAPAPAPSKPKRKKKKKRAGGTRLMVQGKRGWRRPRER